MKHFIIYFFVIVSGSALQAQHTIEIKTADSTIQNYLEKSTRDTTIIDTCITNISYLKFSLNKKGEIEAYTCSRQMPETFKSYFKIKLDSLKGKWNQRTLKYLTKNQMTLLLPVFFNIHQECSIRENFYTKKMDTANTDSKEYSTYMDKALIQSLSSDIISISQNFLNLFDFENDEGFKNGSRFFVLSPCIISRSKTGRVFYR